MLGVTDAINPKLEVVQEKASKKLKKKLPKANTYPRKINIMIHR